MLWQSFEGYFLFKRKTSQEDGSVFVQSGPISSKLPSTIRGLESSKALQTERVGSVMFLQETQLSLQVNDVPEAADKIIGFAQNLGGFLVNSYFSRPDESPYGEITVRVPSGKLQEAMKYYRSLANKVVLENIQGRDISQEYIDIEARLATLRETKKRLEELLNRSGKISELLDAQREILNLQNQIDLYLGQKKYLEESVRFVKITVYLATDEFALPYAPSGTFNIRLMFKHAFRSMMATVSILINAIIWVVVYVPLVAVIGGALYTGCQLYQKKRFKASK